MKKIDTDCKGKFETSGLILQVIHSALFSELSQLSVESHPGLLWFRYGLLCDWSRKTRAIFSTNQMQVKNKCDLTTRVFPRFKQFA